jgi:hypothetical protein
MKINDTPSQETYHQLIAHHHALRRPRSARKLGARPMARFRTFDDAGVRNKTVLLRADPNVGRGTKRWATWAPRARGDEIARTWGRLLTRRRL